MCVDAGGMCTILKAFPKGCREDLTRVYRESDASLPQVAKDLGICRHIKRWITIEDRQSASPSPAAMAATESEAMHEGNKPIELLEPENEVVGRATDYLSQARLAGR